MYTAGEQPSRVDLDFMLFGCILYIRDILYLLGL